MSIQALILFFLLVALLYMVIDMLIPNPEKEILDRLEGLKLYSAPEKERILQESLLTRIYKMAERNFLRYFGEQVGKGKLAPLQMKLKQAGMDIDPIQHRAKRFIFAIALASIMIVTHDTKLIFFGAVVGYIYPDYRLKKAKEARQLTIQEEIPDFLDLLASVFPGCKGFEDAVMKIVARSNESDIVVNEFKTAIEEIVAGKRKRDALLAMSDRCGVPQIESLVNQIIQSEMLGTELSETLEMQAEKMREMKKQTAEIKARNASVSLLMPSVFLLATIIIVIAGPSLMQFMKAMGGM